MGKFEKYHKDALEFEVDGEKFTVPFTVRDRIKLAAAYDQKDLEARYTKVYEFYAEYLKKNYPTEKPSDIDDYLNSKMEKFSTELMIAAGLTTREEQEKLRADVIKKVMPQ
jgi:hypothetical protein